MTYEQIQEVSKSIKTTDIRGKQYAEVNQRIKAFRMLCPNGSISTEILSDKDGVVIMKASVMDEDGKLLGTGTAYEKEGSSNINKTSYIENCETSAVGRALAMCGIGIDTSVASFEEVEGAISQQESKSNNNSGFPNRKKLIEFAESHYKEGEQATITLCKNWNVKAIKDLTDDQLKAIYSKFGGR